MSETFGVIVYVLYPEPGVAIQKGLTVPEVNDAIREVVAKGAVHDTGEGEGRVWYAITIVHDADLDGFTADFLQGVEVKTDAPTPPAPA